MITYKEIYLDVPNDNNFLRVFNNYTASLQKNLIISKIKVPINAHNGYQLNVMFVPKLVGSNPEQISGIMFSNISAEEYTLINSPFVNGISYMPWTDVSVPVPNTYAETNIIISQTITKYELMYDPFECIFSFNGQNTTGEAALSGLPKLYNFVLLKNYKPLHYGGSVLTGYKNAPLGDYWLLQNVTTIRTNERPGLT